jgi:hypothetical protein
LIVYPAIADLSQWVLTITGLKPGKYQVGIDGVNVAVVSSDELGKGWNMGLLEKGSVAEQCRKILMQVRDKERLVGKWRQQAALGAGLEAVIGGMNNCSGLRKKVVGTTNIPDANSLRVVLEKLNSQILEADAKIRETAHPQSHHFVVAPFRTVETLTQMDGS